jgi:hypothetical protein
METIVVKHAVIVNTKLVTQYLVYVNTTVNPSPSCIGDLNQFGLSCFVLERTRARLFQISVVGTGGLVVTDCISRPVVE